MTLSLVAAVLAAAFATAVARRWAATRRPAFGAWTAGLLIFSAAAALQAAGERHGFTDALFRAFYLLGGILGVAYLAQGTVYLMAPRRAAHACLGVLLALTAVSLIAVLGAPVDGSQLGTTGGVLGDAFTGRDTALVRGLAALLNAGGTLVLVGGSAWSAWRLLRDHAGLDRVICNVLLTAGALVVALGLTLARVDRNIGGGLSTLGACEAAGIAVMFAGFLSLGRPALASRSGLRGRGTGPAAPARPEITR